MKRAMTREKITTVINLLARDIYNSHNGLLMRVDENTWELRMEDVRQNYDEYLTRQFYMYNQKCEVDSFVIEAKKTGGDTLFTLKKIKFNTYRPEGFSYKKVEMELDIECFREMHLLGFLLVFAEAAYLADGDFPMWFSLGYNTEMEYNEVAKKIVEGL